MNDLGVYKVDSGNHLQDKNTTLFIIDDCNAGKELTKKKDMLSYLAFSGRHMEHSVWVLTQKYNSVLKDLREQTKWVALFHCKDCIKNRSTSCLYKCLVKLETAEQKNSKIIAKV